MTDKVIHSAKLFRRNLECTLCADYEELVRADFNVSKCGYANPSFLLNIVQSPRNSGPGNAVTQGIVGKWRIKAIDEGGRRLPPEIGLRNKRSYIVSPIWNDSTHPKKNIDPDSRRFGEWNFVYGQQCVSRCIESE